MTGMRTWGSPTPRTSLCACGLELCSERAVGAARHKHQAGDGEEAIGLRKSVLERKGRAAVAGEGQVGNTTEPRGGQVGRLTVKLASSQPSFALGVLGGI